MADNSFRTSRLDASARSADAANREAAGDPLAELARLIGQSGQHGDHDFDAAAEALEPTAPAASLDWAAVEEYAPEHPETDRRSSWASRDPDDAEGQYPAARYLSSLAARHEVSAEASEDAVAHDARYRDEAPLSGAESPPYLAGGDRDPSVGMRDFAGPGDDVEHEDDHDLVSTRRSGTVLIIGVLGLAVLGSAAALGYHAMFGGSVISSLPPIIKPGTTPVKIVPSHEAQAGAPSTSSPNTKATGDRLVTHEEKPVEVQSANPAPHVVTTIPVLTNAPDVHLPDAQQPPLFQPAPPLAPGSTADESSPASGAAAPDQPVQQATGLNQLVSPDQLPGSKPVHTVTIRPGQLPTAPPPARPAAAAHPTPIPTHQAATAPTREPPTRMTSRGPLSIMPEENGANRAAAPAAAQPMRSAALRQPGSLSLTPPQERAERSERSASVGGYAVQVSAQRSEAEAMAAFRALQAKFPQQLGGRHADVRRADLGSKGVFYRALVGPFASSEEAASLCSRLKSAGGSCLVQRD